MKSVKLLLIAAMAFSANAFANVKKEAAQQATDVVQQRVKLDQNFAKSEISEKVQTAQKQSEKFADKTEKMVEKGKKSAKVNVNTADLATLQTLNGIGEVKAKAIIEYRNKHGKIKNAKDLENVPGIGEGIIEKIKSDIRF